MSITYPFQGKRVELIPQPGGFQRLQPGEYGRWNGAEWYGCVPTGAGCNLGRHRIVEHADGTISAWPSIEVKGMPEDYWHGFLTRGVWTLTPPPDPP